jgi:peptidase E
VKDVRQIIAMGGGGFTMEPGNPLLDEYILSQSHKENPNICFLPTASRDNTEYILEFYDYFTTQQCCPTHLALSDPPTRDLESFLLDNHILYVGGGHTGHMLTLWKQFGIDKLLKKAWEMGILLAGVSAGASCWFEMALTDSIPGELTGEPCLGFLKGSHCAHYDNPERRPTFHRLIAAGELPEGLGTDNFAALHFIDNELKKVVGSRPGAATYSVCRCNDSIGIVEKKIESIYLGT